jgi:hypothetical protein
MSALTTAGASALLANKGGITAMIEKILKGIQEKRYDISLYSAYRKFVCNHSLAFNM